MCVYTYVHIYIFSLLYAFKKRVAMGCSEGECWNQHQALRDQFTSLDHWFLLAQQRACCLQHPWGSCQKPVQVARPARTAQKPHAWAERWGVQRPLTGCYKHSVSLLVVVAAHSRRHELREQSLFICWADGNIWPLGGFFLPSGPELPLFLYRPALIFPKVAP